tara:strand:- start:659 stop:808 length:150 start_codon:yes stop_codon:yes gene_type:complete
MDFLIELTKYFKTRKKYWLLPMVIIFLIFGGLIFLTQGTVFAPFIYTIF